MKYKYQSFTINKYPYEYLKENEHKFEKYKLK